MIELKHLIICMMALHKGNVHDYLIESLDFSNGKRIAIKSGYVPSETIKSLLNNKYTVYFNRGFLKILY